MSHCSRTSLRTRVPTIAQLVRKGRGIEGRQDQDAGVEGFTAASRGVCTRALTHTPKKPTSVLPQGGAGPPHSGVEVDRLHPWYRPQSPGALDRARARRVGPKDLPAFVTRSSVARSTLRGVGRQAGLQPLRREEGGYDAAQGPGTAAVAQCPTRSSGRLSCHSARQQGDGTRQAVVFGGNRLRGVARDRAQDGAGAGDGAEARGRERAPRARGEEPPRRWCHLPGADGSAAAAP